MAHSQLVSNSDADSSSIKDAAIGAARRGFSVFPCRRNGKIPAYPDHTSNSCLGADPRCQGGHTGWEPRATRDEHRIRRAWTDSPQNNYGVACGPSGLVVLDLDTHGALPAEWQLPGIVTGADVLAQICEWAGMDWPATYTVVTPSGGMHLYYRAPDGADLRNRAGDTPLGPMIDTRAGGGQVVGAGSLIDGRAYEVTDDQDVQPLPPWIATLLNLQRRTAAMRRQVTSAGLAPGKIDGLLRTVREAQEGTRNHTLFWAACRMALESPDDMRQLADAAAAAGLGASEIRQTISSAQRRVAQ